MDEARQRVIGVLFDATEQVRAEERLMTVNEELRHRLKNMANLAGLFARQTWPRDAKLDTYMGRIRALTMSADLMFAPRGNHLRLKELVARSFEPFRPDDNDPFEVSGPDVDLTDKAFTGVALVFHELATNAAKHGALSVPEGRICLTWQIEAEMLRITWREVAGPPVDEPATRGFGLNVLFRGALPPPHGVHLDFRPGGLEAVISINLLA